MLSSKRVYLAAFLAVSALGVLVACESDSTEAPGPVVFDASIDANQQVPTPNPTDSGTVGSDAGTDALNCTPNTIVPQADGGLFLEPSPYLQASDSPFYCRPFTYYHLANFEGDGGLPPGLSATLGALGTAPGTLNSLIDSVDGDDGIADGGPDGATYPCERCNSWFNGNGAQGVSFEFDGAALGGLPTHVGLVWTDGNGPLTVTFTAYGAEGNVLGTQVFNPIGDSSNFGGTQEDRFFGIVNNAGIKRILMTNSSGGIEVDHVQYGR